MSSNPQALIGLIRRYDKGIRLTDGEIIYCLNEIERYIVATDNDIFRNAFKDNKEDKFLKKLIQFKSNLLAEKRLRVINKIL